MKHAQALPKKFPYFLFTLAILASCNPNNQEKFSSIVQLPDPLEAGWNNKPVCEVLEENPKIRILKCTFPPGVGHEKHYHNPHVGYTLAGGLFRITDESGTKEVNVRTGISFTNDSITSHEVLNIGETIAEFLIIEYK